MRFLFSLSSLRSPALSFNGCCCGLCPRVAALPSPTLLAKAPDAAAASERVTRATLNAGHPRNLGRMHARKACDSRGGRGCGIMASSASRGPPHPRRLPRAVRRVVWQAGEHLPLRKTGGAARSRRAAVRLHVRLQAPLDLPRLTLLVVAAF